MMRDYQGDDQVGAVPINSLVLQKGSLGPQRPIATSGHLIIVLAFAMLLGLSSAIFAETDYDSN
jgi:hypothetical protein